MEKQESRSKTEEFAQGPEWEVPEHNNQRSFGLASGLLGFSSKPSSFFADLASFLRNTFERILPASKTYTPLKLRRSNCLLISCAIITALLALILGLAIGLSLRRKHSGQNLPLPTGTAIYHGDLTYYNPGLGACGISSTDSDNIVAISHALWDSQATGSDPNANPLCGRLIRAERFDNRVGKNVSLDVKVVDRCVGCQPTDLDVSPGAFDQLADPDLGRVHDLYWAWI